MPLTSSLASHRFGGLYRFLQSGWVELSLALLAVGIGISSPPETALTWLTLAVFGVGAAVSGIAVLLGTALVCVGLLISLTLPPDQVSAAGLALFVPIIAAVRLWSRYAIAITLVLVGLGFYTMFVHATGDRPLTMAVIAIFPTLLALSVGAGLVIRSSRQQLENERQRADERLAELRLELARELHDNAVHKISQAAMLAHMAALHPDTPPELSREFTEIATSCNDAAHELRLLLTGLRQDNPNLSDGQPQIIDADALTALIEGQADRLAALGFAVSHDLKIDAPTSLQCRTLAAISVEAVNNIIQHAPARSDCSIRVVQQGSTVVAEFTNHTRSARQAATRPSFGLLGIEERARAAGGYITISKPPGYWRLEVTLPSLPSVVDAEPRSQSPAASPTFPPEQGKPSLTDARPTDYRI